MSFKSLSPRYPAMPLALEALCTALKHEVPDQTTSLARPYAEMGRKLDTLQREHVRRLEEAEDERSMLRIRDLRLEDQVIEARDEAEDAESDIHLIQARTEDALTAIAMYRYARDAKYLGRAMVLLEASLDPAPQDVTESDQVVITRGETRRVEKVTPSSMAIVTTAENDTMRMPMHTLRRGV